MDHNISHHCRIEMHNYQEWPKQERDAYMVKEMISSPSWSLQPCLGWDRRPHVSDDVIQLYVTIDSWVFVIEVFLAYWKVIGTWEPISVHSWHNISPTMYLAQSASQCRAQQFAYNGPKFGALWLGQGFLSNAHFKLSFQHNEAWISRWSREEVQVVKHLAMYQISQEESYLWEI